MPRFVKLTLATAMLLFSQATIKAQCPSVVLSASGGNCLGNATLSLSGADSAQKIVWYKNGTVVKTVVKKGYASSGITVAGGNGTGNAADKLNHPHGIYVDAGGNIFVTDIIDSNCRIQKWAPGASSGLTAAGGQGHGSAANKLYGASDVYVDTKGNMFIADTYNHRIQKWTPGADSGITVAGGGGYGAATNQLSYPSGVYVDAVGNIFIADRSNHRIQKWPPGADTGITVAGGNGYGASANQLYSPAAMYVDLAGNIFVADWSNNRIQKWAPGATSGITVAGGHGVGSAANQLNGASDVYVDAIGNIFIADAYNNRVQKWAPGADSGITVAGGNGVGAAANQLNNPRGVFVDAAGNIFITDSYNNRVQKWVSITANIDTNYAPLSAGNYTAIANYPGSCTATSNAVVIIDTTHPTISNFFPKKTRGGTWVSITGTNFTGATAVSFGGIAADSFTVIKNDSIIALPGAGASGSVSVSKTCGGTASLNGFQYCSLPAPIINISSTCLGDTLQLSGAGSALQITWYNNSTALPSNTSFVIPAAAGSYTAVVKMPGGCTDTSNAVIVYTSSAPVITSFSPQNAGLGTTVTITGNNFSGATSVTFGGVAAAAFTVVNDNTIKAITAASANGSVSVSTSCGGTGFLDGFRYCSTPTPAVSTAAICLGDNLFLNGADSALQIVWNKNGAAVNTVNKTGYASSGITVAGKNGVGEAANQLNYPKAVYVDVAGNIFIGERGNHRIQKWAPGADSGITVGGGNGEGAAANQLRYPDGLYVDVAGNIFIADEVNHRIQKWSPGATSGITVAGGLAGTAANRLWFPHDVYVDASGNIFVADGDNHRVQKWLPGATSGITVAGGNGAGAAANQLNIPHGIYLDSVGNIFIADTYNNRIQKWVPGATSGITVVGGTGFTSPAANGLSYPMGVYVDATGNIFIADTYNNRIQKWVPGATSGITIAGGNGVGPAANQLNLPWDIHIDGAGNVFIVDSYNNRVQKWAAISTIDTIFIPSSPGSYTAVVTYPGGCTVTSNAVMVTSCNYWTGAVNSLWNVPGNWSTGLVPDANTAVFINSGTVVVNADAICYSLSAAHGVNFTVNPGVHLTVLH